MTIDLSLFALVLCRKIMKEIRDTKKHKHFLAVVVIIVLAYSFHMPAVTVFSHWC